MNDEFHNSGSKQTYRKFLVKEGYMLHNLTQGQEYVLDGNYCKDDLNWNEANKGAPYVVPGPLFSIPQSLSQSSV